MCTSAKVPSFGIWLVLFSVNMWLILRVIRNLCTQEVVLIKRFENPWCNRFFTGLEGYCKKKYIYIDDDTITYHVE